MNDSPTRRSILGTMGAAALAGIFMPWKPKPSDLLLADETPANTAAPITVDIPSAVPPTSPTPLASPMDLIGCVLQGPDGQWFAQISQFRMTQEFDRMSTFADGRWKPGRHNVVRRLELDCVMGDEQQIRDRATVRIVPGPRFSVVRH